MESMRSTRGDDVVYIHFHGGADDENVRMLSGYRPVQLHGSY